MRLLKESLLSFFVAGVVLSLYVLAAGAAFFSYCGFVSHRNEWSNGSGAATSWRGNTITWQRD